MIRENPQEYAGPMAMLCLRNPRIPPEGLQELISGFLQAHAAISDLSKEANEKAEKLLRTKKSVFHLCFGMMLNEDILSKVESCLEVLRGRLTKYTQCASCGAWNKKASCCQRCGQLSPGTAALFSKVKAILMDKIGAECCLDCLWEEGGIQLTFDALDLLEIKPEEFIQAAHAEGFDKLKFESSVSSLGGCLLVREFLSILLLILQGR